MQNLIFPLLIVVLAVPLFLSARKQKRNAAKQQELQSSITVGDRVMTTSGLYGTVAETSDATIDIEIAPGLVTTWLRAAVREKVQDEADTEVDDTDLSEFEDDATSDNGSDTITEQASGAELAPPLEHGKKSR
ncbi:MAG: preprotein translocase subunit YajC [Sciscionella sp.]